MSKPPVWFLATRPQFLTLAVALVLHGSALAFWAGSFNWLYFVLALVGLVLMHGAVDVLNDWHDMKTGIDMNVKRTPFSGGSGLLPAGEMTLGQSLALGSGILAAGVACGVYIAWDMGWPWQLLAIGAAGAVLVVIYTPVLNRIGLGEIGAGLGLGVLPVMGAYFVHTGRIDVVAIVSGIPATLLTYNLLLLNEFPDLEADRAGGRFHMLIWLGRKGARWLYAGVEIATYVALVAGVVLGGMPAWALLGLGGAFFAFRAIRGTMRDYAEHDALIPSMGANVFAVLSTNVLMAIGYLVAGLVK